MSLDILTLGDNSNAFSMQANIKTYLAPPDLGVMWLQNMTVHWFSTLEAV